MPSRARAVRDLTGSRMSLRLKLIATSVVLLVGALAISAGLTAVAMHQFLLSRVDEDLGAYAEPAKALAWSQVSSGAVATIQPDYTVRFYRPDGSAEITAVDAVTEDSQPELPRLSATDAHVVDGLPFTVSSVPGSGGDTMWRVVAGVNRSNDAVYAVAVPLDSLSETVTRFVLSATMLGLAIVAIGALAAWVGVGRAFRPLTRMQDTAAAIADGDLAQRVAVPATHDEVASLARSLNRMLAQIEHSFTLREQSEEQMRRFVADASHELRTPLATVQGYAELYRQGALQDAAAVTVAMDRIEGEAARMRNLVEDLLALARLDGERPLELREVDLAVLAMDTVADARVRAPQRAIRCLGLGGPLGPVIVEGDESRLRQVVTNLVANALVHTPDGTSVEVRVGEQPGPVPSPQGGASHPGGDGRHAVVQVRDHGPGIDADDVRRVFERFFRADPARTRARGGSGLGLAIVAAIVERHGGAVSVAQTPGGGATFTVELPLADGSGSDPQETDRVVPVSAYLEHVS